MIVFDDAQRMGAPPEEVWKVLYDPARLPDWWAGVDHPEYPMPRHLRQQPGDRRVMLSCLATDAILAWSLSATDRGRGTVVAVHVEMPDDQAAMLDLERGLVRESLCRLATLSAA